MNARRLVCSIFVVVGALAFGSVPVLAAAPQAPETGKATGITATTADLGGVLNPHAAGEAGFYYFVYAPHGLACIEYGVSVEAITAGFEKELVGPVEIAGLEPSTLYTFCLVDRNEAGEATVGSSETFTTLPAPPAVEGEAASGVSSTVATLEGLVNPNNQVSSCEIQYGATTTYGTSAPCEPASLEGFGDQRASLSLTGLAPGTTYHFRIVAENAGKEKTEGSDQAFTTVPTPNTDPVSAIAARTATFNGHLTLDPVDTQYSFEYKIGPECTGESATSAGDAGSGPGTLASPSTPVTGLIPATQYTVCMVTSNAYGSEQGSPVSFTTSIAPPTITGESVTEVTATSAKLNAQIDPGGGETTYHFDYGTTTSYGNSTSESPPVGSDNSQHPAGASIQGLQPGTTYHYRIVAINSQSPVGGTPGPDQTFTTQTLGGEFTLPDNRSYELVSPPEKDGGEVLGPGGGGLTAAGGDATQASEDGRSVSYITNAPVGANPPGNSWSTQLFSTRGPGGWSTQDISPPHPNPVEIGNGLEVGEEYLRFSSDLSHAIVMSPHQQPEPALAPEIHQEVEGSQVPKGQEIYVRDNTTGGFRAVQTSEPLPQITFEGASSDLSRVIFQGPAGLDPKYPGAGGLYEWAAGHSQLVNVLPNREPASGGGLGGIDGVRHAISNDGTRVVWSGEGALFTRDMVSGETVAIGAGSFQVASSDGSRVFYTNGNLFVFNVADKTQVDLGVVGTVFGASEEGTAIYESSSAVLTSTANARGEKATEGANNTYILREEPAGSGSWSPTFITIGVEEGTSEGPSGLSIAPFIRQAIGVSPNGRYLDFMSKQSLTGYDNRDASSGEPDEEVYLYDAQANRLVCASCDPTGARPVGEYETHHQFPSSPLDQFGVWETYGLAASIPGWTPEGANITTGHQPRSVSDSGRLFLTSLDALVPQDINGRTDVYEYEPEGVGSCQSPGFGLSASVVRDLARSGCVGLISAGSGSTDSVFFDASASGKDVFFTTSDGLVSSDKDGTNDMYDARVCSSAEPCAPSLVASPPCSTTDSCRTAPSAQPGVFAAPASATFAGAGNVTPTLATSVKRRVKSRTKAEIRAGKLARALRTCRGRARRQRTVCEARARKRYGPAKTNGRRAK